MTYKYIEIKREEIKKRITPIYHVVNKSGQYDIAQIKWYARWQRYCLFPESDTIWSVECLIDIVDFMRQRRVERRMQNKNNQTAKKAEKIAKQLSKKYYGTDAMWEVCLSEAYKLFPRKAKKTDNESNDQT